MDYRFSHTRLLVNNFKDCFVFYRDMMGFKPTWGSEDDTYASFDTGDVSLALFVRQAMSEAIASTGLPPEAKSQDTVCLCFEVENVDTTCQKLKEKGVGLVAEPADRPDWGIRTAHFRDPAGNLIEISQGLPQQQ